MRVHVDDDRCGGHGNCSATCPEVFELTDDGYAVAVDGDIPAEFEAAVKNAVGNCPERAISTS